jgi:hypothetical protein
MEQWNTENHPTKQFILAAGCLLTGAVIVYSARGYSGYDSNAFAGFLLGILLLSIGIAALITVGKQRIIIDPDRQKITVRDTNLWGTSIRSIIFQEISRIEIGSLGKRSSGVMFYYLILRLRSDAEFVLFAPGRFYPGSSNRLTVEGWKERLEQYIKES